MNKLEIGSFIKGQYKYGCICGKVVSIKKNHVVIQKYNQSYENYTPTEELVNVTIKRIHFIEN